MKNNIVALWRRQKMTCSHSFLMLFQSEQAYSHHPYSQSVGGSHTALFHSKLRKQQGCQVFSPHLYQAMPCLSWEASFTSCTQTLHTKGDPPALVFPSFTLAIAFFSPHLCLWGWRSQDRDPPSATQEQARPRGWVGTALRGYRYRSPQVATTFSSQPPSWHY